MTLGGEGDLPTYVIDTREGVKKIIFGSLGDVLKIRETADKPMTMQEVRKKFAEDATGIQELIDEDVNPDFCRKSLKIHKKMLAELERRSALKAAANDNDWLNEHQRAYMKDLKRKADLKASA